MHDNGHKRYSAPTWMLRGLGLLALGCGGTTSTPEPSAVVPTDPWAGTLSGVTAVLIVNTSGDEAVAGGCSFREAILAANSGVSAGGCPAGNPWSTDIVLNIDVSLSQQRNIMIEGSIRVYTELKHRPQISGGASAIVVSPNGRLQVEQVRFSGFTTTVLFVDSNASSQGTLLLEGCEVSDNDGPIASVRSVGIVNHGGYVGLKQCLLQRNIDSMLGGALLNVGGSVDIETSSITENAAGHAGGGVYNGANGSMRVFNSTISGNRQTSNANGGGGIFNESGTIDIDFSTIADNRTRVDGSGVKNLGGTINIKRSIISGNFLDGPFGGQGLDCAGAVRSDGYNLYGDCADWAGGTGDKQVFEPKLEPLGAQSDWSTKFMKVRADSPARDAIPVGTWCPRPAPRDQMGQARPTLAGCEMGAVELY